MKSAKTLLVLFLLIGLGACAGGRTRICSELAGPGWTRLAAPPTNADDLLALENLPGGPEVLWFTNGPDRAFACFYAQSLNNPSCGGTTGYEFERKDGRWGSRNLRSQVCPLENDT
jgi:hypothetical protein